MDGKVVSCEAKKWEDRVYYNLGVLLGDCLGFVNSSVAYKMGDTVSLTVKTDKDHRFRIVVNV